MAKKTVEKADTKSNVKKTTKKSPTTKKTTKEEVVTSTTTTNNEHKEVSVVEERLKSLYGLQKIMSKIDEIKILRGDLPLEVQDLEDEILGLKTRLERYNNDIKDGEKEITGFKNAIEEARLKIDKKTEQQSNVVNNREYEILSKELENLNLDIQIYERKINETTETITTTRSEFDELEALIQDKTADLTVKKEELSQIIKDTENEEIELRATSKEIEATIEARLLTAFKRIRKNARRNGLAVVPVERSSCSGCFSKIPPQRQLDIRLRKKIIVCENCGRILIDFEMTQE